MQRHKRSLNSSDEDQYYSSHSKSSKSSVSLEIAIDLDTQSNTQSNTQPNDQPNDRPNDRPNTIDHTLENKVVLPRTKRKYTHTNNSIAIDSSTTVSDYSVSSDGHNSDNRKHKHKRWTTPQHNSIKKLSDEALYYAWCYKYLADRAGHRDKYLKTITAVISIILASLATMKFLLDSTPFKIAETALTVAIGVITSISMQWKLNEIEVKLMSSHIECTSIKTDCVTARSMSSGTKPDYVTFHRTQTNKLDILKSEIDIPDYVERRYKAKFN